MNILLVVLLALAGCIKPPPRPKPLVTLELPAPYCPSGDAAPVPTGVCDGQFTAAGLFACALCPADSGCVDAVDMVYCAKSCRDPLCTYAAHYRPRK